MSVVDRRANRQHSSPGAALSPPARLSTTWQRQWNPETQRFTGEPMRTNLKVHRQ